MSNLISPINPKFELYISEKYKTISLVYNNYSLYTLKNNADRFIVILPDDYTLYQTGYMRDNLMEMFSTHESIVLRDIKNLLKIYENWFYIEINPYNLYLEDNSVCYKFQCLFNSIDKDSPVFPYKEPKLSPNVLYGTMGF